ncbi:RNA polymerase subunit sigma-24 [Verrucomicrobiota bacterium]|nr:RNA polymerase subunit sigma-24 [Verrucomicrobiota bacterium]
MTSPADFRTTRWTQVLAARGESASAKSALSDLCAAYYAPVVAFLRADGREEDAARELAHDFFARVLERSSLGGADPARGRFRSYLLGALKHFLTDHRRRAVAAKRGSGSDPVPLSTGTDTSPGCEIPDSTTPPSDLVFDRQWALTLLDRSLLALATEFASAAERAQFEALKPWLTGEPGTPQSAVAAQLGLNENAVKVAIHRLRRRFRELVKSEIAQTVADPAEQRAELEHLIRVLAA